MLTQKFTSCFLYLKSQAATAQHAGRKTLIRSMRSEILERVTNESFVIDHVTLFAEVPFIAGAFAGKMGL